MGRTRRTHGCHLGGIGAGPRGWFRTWRVCRERIPKTSERGTTRRRNGTIRPRDEICGSARTLAADRISRPRRRESVSSHAPMERMTMSKLSSVALLGGQASGKTTYMGAIVRALESNKLSHLKLRPLPEDA